MTRTVTPNTLYQMPADRVERNLASLKGCYYDHVPEVDGILDPGLGARANERVEVRVLRHVDYDYRRFWRLATVWFDDAPVMVIQNAGREGDDHAKRFITNPDRYQAMVTYLRSLVGDERVEDVVDPNAERGDLTEFYGDAL